MNIIESLSFICEYLVLILGSFSVFLNLCFDAITDNLRSIWVITNYDKCRWGIAQLVQTESSSPAAAAALLLIIH